jgi:beta-phosphoglucomutase
VERLEDESTRGEHESSAWLARLSEQETCEPRAVIWDVDGTLIDSSEFHWTAWRDALAAEDFALTRERFEASFGQRNDAVLRGLFGEDFPPSEIERIADSKERLYRRLVRERGVEPLPGVRRWLRRLAEEGWSQAIASSAPAANLEAILDALELRASFAAIVSAEDVERGKPDPQIFLVAAGRLKVEPRCSVVVEDAPAGLEGARRAGMRTIGLLTTHAVLEADLVLRSLEDLPVDAFRDRKSVV